MKRVILAFIILLLLAQVSIAFLLGTSTGTRWLLQRAAPLAPGELTIEHINGALLDEITLDQVRYRLGTLDLSAQKITLQLQLPTLWSGWVHFPRLYLHGMTIKMPPANPEAAGTAPSSMRLPIGIRVDDGVIEGLQLTRADTPMLHLDQLQVAALQLRWQLRADLIALQQGNHAMTLRDSRVDLASPFDLESNLSWQSQQPTAAQWLGSDMLAGHARLLGPLDQLNVDHHLTQPLTLHSTLIADLLSADPHVQSRHRLAQGTLLLPDSQAVTLRATSLQLDLNRHRFVTALDADITLPGEESVEVSLQASGTPESAEQMRLRLQHEHALLILDGQARWSPTLAIDMTLEQTSWINPGRFHPDLAARLGIRAHIDAERRHDQWAWRVRDLALQGRVREQAVGISLSAQHNGTSGDLSGTVRVGNNNVELDGRSDNDQIDLRAAIQAPALDALHPLLRGNVYGQVHVQGDRQAPLLNADLNSDLFAIGPAQLHTTNVQGRNIGAGSQAMSLQLHTGRLTLGPRQLLDRFTLSAQGRADQHTISWQAAYRDATLQAQLNGALTNSTHWQGVVRQLTLALPDQPLWELADATPLSVAPDQIRLDNLCLGAGDGKLCTTVQQDDRHQTLALTVDSLPLAPLAIWLGSDVTLEGYLQQSLSLSRRRQGTWQGQFQMTLPQAAVIFDDGPQRYRLQFDEAGVQGSISENRLRAEGGMQIAQHGHLGSRLALDLSSPAAALDMNIDVAINELRWLELLVPAIRQPEGMLYGQLQITGSLQEPHFDGELQLDRGTLDIPAAGINVNGVQAMLRGTGRELTLQLEAHSGPGELNANGTLNLDQGLPGQLDLTLGGNRFRVLQTSEADVLVNPALTLRQQGSRLVLRGEVDIPEASLTPLQLPEVAVRVSEDEVVIDQTIDKTPLWQMDTDVLVRIGNKVTFQGFGLDARLTGNLQLQQAPEQPVSLSGDLRIVEGRYRAYGQNLAIDRGLLLFQQRVDNPGLNIRAVRRIPSAQVVAGVEIAGTLQTPEARLVSEPAMEESEIMAWLLTGRGLTGGSESDNAMIAQALAVYGLEQGSGITERVGETLGLDEISLGSDWESTDASLMLGKQISDRLYLRYAIGLFDAISAVMLRYTINRRLHLEAQSGTERQSLDLIYQIER